MRILFQSRTSLFNVPGGDTVQILKTKEYLEKLRIHVDVSTELQADVSKYDIVHLFNLIRPQDVLIQIRNAKRYDKKVVLSTIYGLYTEYDRCARTGISQFLSRRFPTSTLEYLKTIARVITNKEIHNGTIQYLACGHMRAQREIISRTDVFLPNSTSEMRRVLADFSESQGKRFVVVPNAVDTSLFNSDKINVSKEVMKYDGCVLCVARIEGRKSQLNLVRAMKDLPWQLVLIGTPAPNHMGYNEQIKNEAGNNVHILGQMDHHLLPQFYKAAKVHALISWMETPGLSSLEAAVMGCNLVITDKGDTRDYFGEYAYYCDPDSVDSIRTALIRAYETSLKPTLCHKVKDNFTWERAAEKTMEGYRVALGL